MPFLSTSTLLAQGAPKDLGLIEGFSQGFSSFSSSSDAPSYFAEIVSNIITVLTIFAGLAFLIYFVIGALNWITAAGKPEQLNKAKDQMTTAFAGLFVTVITISIVIIIGKITGFNIIDIETILNNITP